MTSRRSFLGLLAKAGAAAACAAVFPAPQLGAGGPAWVLDAASYRMTGLSVDIGKGFSRTFLSVVSAAGEVLWSGPADAGEIVFDAPINAEDIGYLQRDTCSAEPIEVDFTCWSVNQ